MNSQKIKSLLKQPLFVACAMNLVMLVLGFVLSGGQYCSLDDHFMAAVLTGAYGGNYDPHMYFVGGAYAWFLKPFYLLFPSVGWYSIFQFISVFVSFSAITFVLLKKLGLKLGVVLSALVLVCVSPDFYFHVAFTQCAGALVASGVLLLAFGDSEKKKRYLILGMALLLAGFVMRSQMFLLGLPTLGMLFVLNFVQNKKIWLGSIIALVLGFGLYQGIKIYESSLYKSEGFDYYAAYQPVRAVFGDGNFYDFDATSDELDERGLKSRDLRYLRGWYFYDKDVYSIDSLKPIISLIRRNLYEPNYARAPLALSKAIADEWLSPHLWCWIFLCLSLLFFSKRKIYLAPWVSLGLICMAYLYLLLVNRVAGHVVVGIWLYAVVILIPYLDISEMPTWCSNQRYIKVALLLALLGTFLAGVNVAFYQKSKLPKPESKENPDWAGFVSYARSHSDDVFMLPFGRYKELAKETNIFRAIEPNSWNNIVSSGYWNIHLPAMEEELKKRGVTNLFRDIVNENVYVMEDDLRRSMIPFYQDHYHKKLVVDTVKTFGTLKLLKYRVDEVN